jgi:NAD+ diphosphatase
MPGILDTLKFKYCPRCGEPRLKPNDLKSFICRSCGLIYYHGASAAVAGIIECQDQIILTHRAIEPYKGQLALPGGFVDYAESLEAALIRELQEELNLTVTAPSYLCSNWERYPTRDVLYFITVAFFVIKAMDLSTITARDDVASYQLVRPGDMDFTQLAFDTDRAALDEYRRRIERNK